MKRLSFVLALVAVLALAGTAAAGPALTIRGDAKITLSGNTDDLTPIFGAGSTTFFNLGFNSGFDITGDKWTLGGDLYASGSSFAVKNWKLTINPGIFTFRFANGANYTRSVLSDYGDYLGFLSISGIPENWDHMQLVAPVSGFTLVYDTAVSGSSRKEALYIEMPKGTLPFGFRGLYDLQGKAVAGGIHYDFADNFWAEVGGVTKLGVEKGTGVGAELNIPVSSNLVAYLVAKQYGSGYGATIKNNDGQSVPYALVALGQLTYTQPHYRIFGQGKTYFSDAGAVEHREDLVRLGIVQQAGDSTTWWNTDYADGYTGYRSLKGWAFFGQYDVDNPTLLVAAGAPVIPNKAWLKAWTPNLLAKVKDANGNEKGDVVGQGQLYVKLTDKLTSVTDVKYQQGVGLTQLDDTLTYSVSGSSSIELKLSKPQNANKVNYTATFKVSY